MPRKSKKAGRNNVRDFRHAEAGPSSGAAYMEIHGARHSVPCCPRRVPHLAIVTLVPAAYSRPHGNATAGTATWSWSWPGTGNTPPASWELDNFPMPKLSATIAPSGVAFFNCAQLEAQELSVANGRRKRHVTGRRAEGETS